MALFNLSREERAYKAFFKKTGIQITNKPDLSKNEGLNDELEELYYLSRTHPKKSIPRLEKLKKLYPNIPLIKNLLLAAYSLSGKNEKSSKILAETLEKHPKYVFGISTKILNINDKEELKKHEHLLGTPKDVREFEGYDKPVHISAFKNYQFALIHFDLIMGNEEAAIQKLDTLIDLQVEKEFIEQIVDRIVISRLKNMMENMKQMQANTISAKSCQTVFLDHMGVAPKLNHPELNIFYKKSTSDFSEDDITLIESLPKETLILDLENILEDSIRRWDEFQMEEYDESRYEFLIHALYWLGDLKSTKSLNKVLNLLRMGEEFLNYWMADMQGEFLFPTLYYLGESQLGKLKECILEDNIYPYYRLHLSTVVSQIAIHQPSRRDEVIQWYKDVFDYLLKNPENNLLIDTSFIGFVIDNIIDFRGVELLDYIEKLDKKGWVQESIQGDFEEIQKLLNEPFYESEREPLPLNIREFYSGEYQKRKAERPPLADYDQDFSSRFSTPSKAEELIIDRYMERFSSAFPLNKDSEYLEEEEYQAPKTVVNTTKKIGRNDPCPCGSGKKYKKCCIKK